MRRRFWCFGRRGWEFEQALDLLDRSELLKGTVRLKLISATMRRSPAHLAHARALLFPSLAEGYGLPLAEALQSAPRRLRAISLFFREIAGGCSRLSRSARRPRLGESYSGLFLMDAESVARTGQRERLAKYRHPTWRESLRHRRTPWLANESESPGPSAKPLH